MIPLLKAEFRKVFTVRTTYYLLLFVLALEILFAFFISGWRAQPADLHSPTTLADDVSSAVATLSIFAGLISAFVFTYEYRYNLILYTLTSSKSRSRILLSKILLVTAFSLVFTAICGALSPLLALLGMHLHHLTLIPQTIHYGNLAWRTLFYGWGFSMAGLVIGALVRNQIGAIVVLLIAPETIEGLLSLLLKHNSVYLPFTSLHVIISRGIEYSPSITPFHAVLVFSTYLIVSWVVAWVLFLRRDTAN